MGRLISREYQDERDQQIVLLLDCGRRMAAKDDGAEPPRPRAERRAAARLRRPAPGRRRRPRHARGAPRWFAPRKSLATVQRAVNQVYALEPTLQAPDFYQAAVDLCCACASARLVVILTNLRDEDDDTLMPALALLRHATS
jgi:uncharacterized protein (DUF58 family)